MAKEAEHKTAEQLYLGGHVKTRKELAVRLGVTEATVRAWIDKGNWEERRQATQVSQQNIERLAYRIAEKYMRQLEAKVDAEEPITDGDTNSLHKLASALKNISGHESFRNYTQVVSQFLAWLQERDLAQAQLLLSYADEFLIAKAQEMKR